jgi:hypothetical protein
MKQLKELQSWIIAFEKVNDSGPTSVQVKAKIKQILKEDIKATTSKQIFFRESQWSDYQTLRKDLSLDLKFVKEYAGVDLKVYIEEALAWSEKGHKSTDLGWKLTLKNWMRKAKSNGTLVMKVKDVHNSQGVYKNY